MSEHAHEGLIRYGLGVVWTSGQRSNLVPDESGNLYKADDIDQALAAKDAELEAKDKRIAELEAEVARHKVQLSNYAAETEGVRRQRDAAEAAIREMSRPQDAKDSPTVPDRFWEILSERRRAPFTGMGQWNEKPADPPVTRGELAHIFRTVTGAFKMTRDLAALGILERLEAGQDARGGGDD